jgi:hypothetical protein
MRFPIRTACSTRNCAVAVAFLIVWAPLLAWCQAWPAARLAPYVPSLKDVAVRMLQMAKVGKNDVVYDLGAGDGRVVVLAARDFGAHAVGVEIDQGLCKEAQDKIKEQNLQGKAQMFCRDMMGVNLSDASVVTLYLTTAANEKLRPNLEKYLRKGTRVVSHAFEIPGWKPAKIETWKGDGPPHHIYLYLR